MAGYALDERVRPLDLVDLKREIAVWLHAITNPCPCEVPACAQSARRAFVFVQSQLGGELHSSRLGLPP